MAILAMLITPLMRKTAGASAECATSAPRRSSRNGPGRLSATTRPLSLGNGAETGLRCREGRFQGYNGGIT